MKTSIRMTIVQSQEDELILRCRDPNTPHIRELLAVLGNTGQGIPARAEEQMVIVAPSEVLYAETVERRNFLYTARSVYETALSLAELEQRGLFRCAKSMVVRIDAIRTLKSQTDGRIMATLNNGEQLYISRRYAAALRRVLFRGEKGDKGVQK